MLQVGDLVLRWVMSTKDKHKLSPPWEGPYSIAEVIRPGTYKLKDSDGNILTNPKAALVAQSKCPDPATSGSEHSGARHLSIFFSPHNTVHSHGIPNRPPAARSHSGAAHLNFLHAHSTHEPSGF